MKPWLVLVNPAAGRGKITASHVRPILEERKVPYEMADLGEATTVRERVAQAAAQGQDRFVAVGGMGSLNLLANAVLEHSWENPPTLGLLPTGTATDILRTFGIPQSLERAADRLLTQETYPVDVGIAIGEWGRRYFLNSASCGILAEWVRTFPKLTRLSKPVFYIAALVKTRPPFGSGPISVQMGAKKFAGKACGLLIANGQFMGAGFNVAPRSSMRDGQMDLQVFTTRPRQILGLARRARRGLHLSDPRVHRFSVSQARIESSGSPWPVEVDGEKLGETPVLFRVQPGKVLLKI